MHKSRRSASNKLVAMWQYVPVVVLEQIFAMLSVADRGSCSLVCRHWLVVFRSGSVWRHLVIGDRTFTRPRYQTVPYRQPGESGSLEINHWRLQVYLGQFGHRCRSLTFRPIANFFNLFEFLRILACFIEFFDDYPMPVLDRFELSFACESRYGSDERLVHGTGGQILAELRRLLGNLHDLRTICVNHLLLDETDSNGLLDVVVDNCRDTLRSVQLLNITRQPAASWLSPIERLTELTSLTISPLQLNDVTLVSISRHCSTLRLLTLLEDDYTVHCYRQLDECELARPTLSSNAWRQVRSHLPRLKVRLEYRGPADCDLTLQDPAAPVTTVAYDSRTSIVSGPVVADLVDRYSSTLTTYGHAGIGPRRFRSASFNERADTALVGLVRRCSSLKRLVVRERVSTTTLIVLAAEGKSLEEFVVRRNAVILRSDWTRAEQWTDEFYNRLRSASKSYDETESEISRLLARPWTMLADHAFRRVRV